MSDYLWPHGLQHARLPHTSLSPGKWKSLSLCPTLCNPMDYTVHGILQAEYWSVYPIPSPRDLPNPGIKPGLLNFRQILYQLSYLGNLSMNLLKLMSIESVMPSNHLILCHPLLLLPSIFPSIWVLSNELALHIWWPKYWSFIFSISSSDEYSGLISFRIDWFDLLAVQGTLKSLIQNHCSKASMLQCSAFFMVQLSHTYLTTGNAVALTRWTFVSKVTSLLNTVGLS